MPESIYFEDQDHITNEELCLRIQSGQNNSEDLLQLYTQNRPLIAKWCRRYAAYEDFEDLMQECFLIVADAAQRFDPEVGANFCTFLKVCIQTGLIKYMRTAGTLIHLSEGMRHRIAKYEEFKKAFISENGRSPEGIECMMALGLSFEQYHRMLSAIDGSNITTLDAKAEDLSLYETIPDDVNGILELEDRLTQQQDAEAIRAAVSDLDPAERNLIYAYYYEGKSFEEMSELYGQKQSRLRSKKNSALRKLKRDKRIIRIGRDHGYGSYIYAGGIRRWRQTGYSSVEYAAIRHLEGIRSDR